MLVTFCTKAHADILMLGDIAVQLLKRMGHSGTVPGALLADEVPAALDRLRNAVAVHKAAVPKAATWSPTGMAPACSPATARSAASPTCRATSGQRSPSRSRRWLTLPSLSPPCLSGACSSSAPCSRSAPGGAGRCDRPGVGNRRGSGSGSRCKRRSGGIAP